MRPWIATIASYALALQVLLTGLAIGSALGTASESLFVICHADGASDKQEVPGKEPFAGSPCVFCTLAKASCAILPIGDGIAIRDPVQISSAAARIDDHILQFNSPTGQYQRGPPIGISVLG